jgi:uncharacterized protein (TIGR02271 family)
MDMYTWIDREVIGADGEKIGTIEAIYEDNETGQPDWALVSTGRGGARQQFVPLAGADEEGEAVRVQATTDQVEGAPGIEGDGQLTTEEERQLFEHYGVPHTSEGSTTAADTTGGREGDGDHTSGPTTDDAMTRSEEELRVGTASRERGRARLRKYVVTEEVQTTVPVQREEVRLEHEPITDTNASAAMDGPEISEEEHEVVLHEEQPVVEKRVVPKERVRLGKETVTDEQAVNESVRKEQIEPDGEALGRDIDER